MTHTIRCDHCATIIAAKRDGIVVRAAGRFYDFDSWECVMRYAATRAGNT